MKLTVLGGGGVRSVFLAKAIALGAEEAGIDEVCFMDTDERKLRIFGVMAKEMARRCRPELTFLLTTDERKALEKADYVITTIRAEGDEGRVFDERTALEEGVLGQETTGAGGFAMALRSIRVLTDYCRLMREVSSKDVIVFNFTNPSGLVTQALRSQGYDMVYGVCDAPSGFIRQLGQLFSGKQFSALCYGLNHLSWFRDFQADGVAVTDRLIADERLYTDTEMRLFQRTDFFTENGTLPNEYLYFYYFRKEAVRSILQAGETRGEAILRINREMLEELEQMDVEEQFEQAFSCYMKHYARRENSYFATESGKPREKLFKTPGVREYIEQPEEESYAAVALNFIRARHTGRPVQMVLSVPNGEALPCLAKEDVIEVSCRVDGKGVEPLHIGQIPRVQEQLIRQVKLYENLTVSAVMEKSRAKAVQALFVHPLVGSYSTAERLTDNYLKQYRTYTGEWR